MKRFIRRAGAVVAPAVCAFCDGGSGYLAGSAGQALRACPACSGTGKAVHANATLEELIRSRFASSDGVATGDAGESRPSATGTPVPLRRRTSSTKTSGAGLLDYEPD